jgi:glycosyltransferase involved in cell wall biosynthesis
MNPKVSILIPVYKAEKFFVQCLHSVFTQTYENIEYVFVNDATPDSSMDILQQIVKTYPQRQKQVVIIENERNRGVAYTRNVLLNNASGDFIYYVDSDDFIEPDTIETLVTTATIEKADIVRCNYFEYVNGISTPVLRNTEPDKDGLIGQCMRGKNKMNAMWLLLIRRQLFATHHLAFVNDINGPEDIMMTIKLFCSTNNVAETPKPLYHYRLDNSTSITHNELSFRNHFLLAVEQIVTFLKEKGVYEKYYDQALQLMFTSKQHFLINKRIRNIDKYINTFPESSHCYRQYNYSMKQQLLFFLAEHRMSTILKIINKLI